MSAVGVPTRYLRIVVQTAFFGLWLALVISTRHPIDSWISRHFPVSLFLRLDPLVFTVVSGSLRAVVPITLIALGTILISFLLGRVFCGWVCPLGSVFDFYGWFLRRLRVPFFGPSPRWFRAKYYLLIAVLVIALFGGVSPLMGLDPIVLITRTAASVLAPVGHRWSSSLWVSGEGVALNGAFVDALTIILMVLILIGTTRLSRIWCRAVCPLGAYLAVMSRNSVLRRQTEGCIHCNICARHCPTGAISFENPERYVESECIKCFACSQECPVDANFFAFRSPVPAVTHAYEPVALDRRSVLGVALASAASVPVLRLSSGDSGSSKVLIRPPMSRLEHDFLNSCIRCGECVKACPSGVLKPAGFEHGIRALWTPVMVPQEGFCVAGCNACSQACPTDAILKYPVEKKYAFKAGTAVFQSSLCISYSENKYCSECVRACPTEAIKTTTGWTPPPDKNGKLHGADTPAPEGQTPSRPLSVDFNACVGCGACENVCSQIVYGNPAMVTTSYGRAQATHLKS